jgi:hypothetical protein
LGQHGDASVTCFSTGQYFCGPLFVKRMVHLVSPDVA